MQSQDQIAQGENSRRMWAAVVLESLDEFIRYPIEKKDAYARKLIADAVANGRFVKEPRAGSTAHAAYVKGVKKNRITPVPKIEDLPRADLELIKVRATADGVRTARLWLWSKDGKEVLEMAGINYSDRVCNGLLDFVEAGVTSTVALTEKALTGT